MRRCRPGIHLAIAFVLAPGAWAQEPPPGVVVEPTMVGMDDATMTGKAASELQFTLLHTEAVGRFGNDGADEERGLNRAVFGVATFTHGIGARLDLAASVFAVTFSDVDDVERRASGWGDVFVDVKWRLKGDGTQGWQLAYRPGFSIPLGDEDKGDIQAPGLGFWTVSQALVATVIEGRWVVGFEALAIVPIGDRENARGFGSGSFGAGFQATPRLKPELEIFYGRDLLSGGSDSEVVALTAGLIANLSNTVRLDAGLRRGVWGRNVDERVTVSANVSVTIPRTVPDPGR